MSTFTYSHDHAAPEPCDYCRVPTRKRFKITDVDGFSYISACDSDCAEGHADAKARERTERKERRRGTINNPTVPTAGASITSPECKATTP